MANEAGFIQLASGVYSLGIASVVGFGLGATEGFVSREGGDPLALDILLGAAPVVGAYGGFNVGYAAGNDHEPLDKILGGLYGLGAAAFVGAAELVGYGLGCLTYDLFN